MSSGSGLPGSSGCPARARSLTRRRNGSRSGGGGGVSAIQLALLADEAHLFTALGDDELGSLARTELEERGVRVHASANHRQQRWAFTHIDDVGERTITTVGPKLRPSGGDDGLPWHELEEMDAVLFIAGDVEALLWSRRAAVLTATAREGDVLKRGAVELDALIGSGEDEAERYHVGDLDPEPKLVVTTSGALGGWMQPGGPYTAAHGPRASRGRLRLWGLVHGGADVCARCRPRIPGCRRVRRAVRRCGADGSRRRAAAGRAMRTALPGPTGLRDMSVLGA